MKSIFGFLTGAAVGAGSLFGLRKVLQMMGGPEVAAPASPVSRPAPVVSSVEVTNPKVEIAPETSSTESATTRVSADLEKAQDALGKLEALMSMVGEPPARHQEPIAAVESAPEAITPRSENAEEAVPEKVEVIAATTTPTESKPAAKAAGAENNGAKKPSRTVRTSRTDDFTIILDIGPVFNQKLHDAGIKSFRDLVKLTPAQIEEKTGIPAERIEHGKWLEQVQKIVEGETKE